MAASAGPPPRGGDEGPPAPDDGTRPARRRDRAGGPPPPLAPWLLPSVIVGLSVLLLVIVFGFIVGRDDGAPATAATAPADERPLPELPRGGRELLPGHRVVSYAGAPQDPELGALGVGSLRGALRGLQRQARSYARRTRPAQPALQLISTIAHADPGRDRRYNQHQSTRVIERHLREARRIRALLILDIQPGRSNFVGETRRLERWLREPDVAIAYDPEWRMQKDGDVPGQVIGSVDAPELQRSLDEVARIVREHRLPKKLVIVHRFTRNMIRNLPSIRIPPELQMVMSVDGVGDRANKLVKYAELTRDLPRGWRPGFKVFLKEDRAAGGLMNPRQVMGLRPRPDVVLYE
ncbi:hypothetical protein [Patulibacter minatonensis]|uniref:hypothetical protein n=1 Tax=Patulibacter minatonensis TaxID=298163 RepID=UPI000687BB25|nr:hypothetical protein [Patulibacter minatonensis]